MKETICEQIAGQLNMPIQDIKSVVKEWCARENPKRAVKVRGTFKTLDQTYRRAEEIRHSDANFHIFTCEVGKWLPFDPNPDLLEDENYMEDQLNQLLKGYKLNKMNTKQHYKQRKRDMMEKAIQEGTPEGQQQLMDVEEPYEAVKFKAEQAVETIEQLHTRIKDLEKTKDLAFKKLETMEEPASNKDDKDDKIIANIEVENISENTPSQPEKDHIRGKLVEMRNIQEQSKRLQTQEFASHLQSRGVRPDMPNTPTNSLFDSNNIVPSQVSERNLQEDELYRKEREQTHKEHTHKEPEE